MASEETDNTTFASPFKVADSVELGHFTYAETKSLFEEYQKEDNVKLDEDIIKDIFSLTNG